ncbi:hypothetical protein DP73_03755 [Desulfosporosinus sp. HMP52]|uniref:tetratricopeptide repeat protein n=1 Tax=Desulfosporosinus sp. HMP52 TaxID=1487923 RepID=UPI00051FEE7E|nr:tetratricopeptide repeat protein [Desulfosporosinus sp. HMP52]KGK91392.1 hypothetical protein DP73_03755 [Desulfosporosinus sp. HMP52]
MNTSKKIAVIIAFVVILIGGGVAYATNNPTSRAERQLNLGNKYLQEGKYQEAILAFQKVIEIEPKNIPARLGLGKVYVARNELEKAEAVLKEVVSIDDKNIPAREDLFNVYLKEGNLDMAHAILNEIIQIDPNNNMVKQYTSDLAAAKALSESKANYDKGIQQMNNKQYLEAMHLFEKVIEVDKERFTDAQTKISECNKSYVDNGIQTATDLVRANKYEDAIKILNDVLKMDTNNQDVKKLIDQYTQEITKIKASAAATKIAQDIPTSKTDDKITSIDQARKLIESKGLVWAELHYYREGTFKSDEEISQYATAVDCHPPIAGLPYYEFYINAQCIYVIKKTGDIYTISKSKWFKH